jgi:CDP-glucose 4,6-dehydratase
MAILVTGSEGFLGQHLAEKLYYSNHSLVLLQHDRHRTHFVKYKLVQATGDVCDTALLRRLISKHEVTTVYHLAAQTQVTVGVSDPTETFRTNIQGTWSVLEACRLEKVLRVVIASSDKAVGEGENMPETEPVKAGCPYSTSKACADLLAQSYMHTFGMSIAVTRCGNLYGPGDLNWNRLIPHLCRAYISGKPPILRSDGTPLRDYLYISDAVDAYMLLGASPWKGPINFAGGEAVSVNKVLQLVKEAYLHSRASVCQEPARTLNQPRTELQNQSLDCSAAHMLGWKPKVSLRDGVCKTLQWYEKYLR